MATLDKQLYMIRKVGTEFYMAGSGAYSYPKLYDLSSARRVVTAENKVPGNTWEIVPVMIAVKEAIK